MMEAERLHLRRMSWLEDEIRKCKKFHKQSVYGQSTQCYKLRIEKLREELDELKELRG